MGAPPLGGGGQVVGVGVGPEPRPDPGDTERWQRKRGGDKIPGRRKWMGRKMDALHSQQIPAIDEKSSV